MSNKVESPVSLNTRERTEKEQKELNQQLHEASRNGDNETVTKLLNEGADINYESGWTVLGMAAIMGHTETVRLLISRPELNINKRDYRKMNVLHRSCFKGHINCSRLLVDAGIDLQATDMVHGMNAMHWACLGNRIDTIKYLLGRGLSLDSPQDKLRGRTPRMWLDETKEDVKQFLEELKSQDNTETPAATESTDIPNTVMDDDSHQDTYLDYAPYLEKAASKGTVITRQSSLGLCGAAGTGKTSTLRLITNQPPITVHDSTPILKPEEYFSNDGNTSVHSNPPSEDEGEDGEWNSDEESTQSTAKQQPVAPMKQGLLISNETSTDWKPATQEVMLERLANCTATAVEQEKMAIKGKNYNCLLIKGFAMKNENQIEHKDPNDKPLEDDDRTTQKSLFDSKSSASSACDEISKDILEFLESNKTLKPLGITHFISTCDTGGQAAFLDVAPAFIRYNSVNLILLKLDENLDDPAQFFYSVKGKRVGDEKRQISTRALVHSFVSSKSKIRKPKIKGMKQIQQPQKPKFMILGTHFDKYKENSGKCQSKDEKNRVLKEDLACFGDCLCSNSNTKTMFSLNTLSRDKETKTLASRIRKMVMANYTEAEIPVSWYIFQLAMYKVKSSNENQGMIRLSTLINIGTITRMPQEEVEASLLYFHDLQVCLYFPTVVPNVVFTNPQFLFDKISEIIAFTFYTKVRKVGTTDDDLQKLIECGIFTETFLKHVCKGFNDDFLSSKDFLALMSHLFVVCSLPGTDEYFMPCVLVTHPNPCEDFSRCSVKPLAFTWDKSVPSGLFPSLTTKIQARNGINGFRFTMSQVQQQYRNRITLHSDDLGCNVTLVECTSFIAASINKCIPLTPNSDSRYVKVRGVILRCIDDIVNRLDWVQAEPEECFICDTCPSDCPVHLCYPDKFLTVLSCCKTETTTTLTASHLAWKGPHDDPDTPPNSSVSNKSHTVPPHPFQNVNNQLLELEKDCNDVVIALTPVHHMWDKLGRYLNIPDNIITCIRDNKNNSDPFRLMSDLTSTWIRRPTKEHHPSWRVLCQALENMGEAALAEKIATKYKDTITDHCTSEEVHVRERGDNATPTETDEGEEDEIMEVDHQCICKVRESSDIQLKRGRWKDEDGTEERPRKLKRDGSPRLKSRHGDMMTSHTTTSDQSEDKDSKFSIYEDRQNPQRMVEDVPSQNTEAS